MGMMDDMKGKMSGMTDDMQERYNMLMNKEQDGTISDAERDELMTLRSRMTPDSGK